MKLNLTPQLRLQESTILHQSSGHEKRPWHDKRTEFKLLANPQSAGSVLSARFSMLAAKFRHEIASGR